MKVRLYAGLELSTQDGRLEYEFETSEATMVRIVAEGIGLAPGEIGLILVNGRHVQLDDRLEPGDEVAIFPPLGGG